MKKALALVLAATLALGLAACSKKNEVPDDAPELDMTPSITAEELAKEVDFEKADFATAEEDKEHVISSGRTAAEYAETENVGDTEVPLAMRSTLPPDEVWSGSSENGAASYTGASDFTLPESVEMTDGSLGQLSIPKVGLKVSIYETDDELESMAHGVAHFKETSCWDGNVGLAGHNQGVNTYFGQIHTLVEGDEITLTTALGTRTYKVTTKVEIDEKDWSYLGRSDNNVITLITCVNHDLSKRLCVQAVEVA